MVVKAVSGSTNISMNVICYGPVYPTSDSYLTATKPIHTTGDVNIQLNIVPANVNDDYAVDWAVTGTPITDGYVTIKSQNNTELVFNVNTIYQDANPHEINITATITRSDGVIYAIKTVAVITTSSYLFTKNDNAEVVAKMYADGKCASSYGMTEAECEAVTTLGVIFNGDKNLKSFNELQYFTKLTSIGDNCFGNCTSLTSITIPNSVTSLGDSCFQDCTSLTSITIPNSVTSLDSTCFYDCTSLTSITLPNSINSLPSYCFYNCTSLTSITIPNSVTMIGNFCFYSCKSLTSITIPNSVTSLSSRCFQDCTSLTSITIPNSVTMIGDSCFFGCTSLTSITIPNSVTSLSGWCFGDCKSLTSITIPNSVTMIGNFCLGNCTLLTSINCLAVSAPTTYKNTFGDPSFSYPYYYTGSRSRGTNYLYVPSNATGYEGTTGDGWAVLLDSTKCNFKISKTL